MTEPRDDEHQEEPDNAGEDTSGERINDPLTQTDVQAPRVRFGSQPPASSSEASSSDPPGG
jgi:hypothetical protein